MKSLFRTKPKPSLVARRTFASAADEKLLKNLRKAALDVHKQLLIQANKWPAMPGLEDRSIKVLLIPRIEQDCQTIDKTQEKAELLAMGQKAQKDLQGAVDLLSNKSLQKYKLETYLVPKVVEKHSTILSSKSQKKIRSRRWGVLDRLFTFFLDDPMADKPVSVNEHKDSPSK